MNLALQKINYLIADARPDHYDSMSFNSYFKNLTEISSLILTEEDKDKQKLSETLKFINDIPVGVAFTNDQKTQLMQLLLK